VARPVFFITSNRLRMWRTPARSLLSRESGLDDLHLADVALRVAAAFVLVRWGSMSAASS